MRVSARIYSRTKPRYNGAQIDDETGEDMILLMTVNPGFGGQSYIPAMTEKIRTLRHILEEKGLQTDIEIDGGVDTKNLRMVIEAGANVLVSGSKIFGGDIAENVHQFNAMMAEYTK